jgi:hypothetical protein
MRLLSAALQKQEYNLAAHILVYGLVKASVGNPRDSLGVSPLKLRGARGVMNTDFPLPRKCHGNKSKKQEKT